MTPQNEATKKGDGSDFGLDEIVLRRYMIPFNVRVNSRNRASIPGRSNRAPDYAKFWKITFNCVVIVKYLPRTVVVMVGVSMHGAASFFR